MLGILISSLGSGSFDIIYKIIRKFDQKEFCLKQSPKIDNDKQFELCMKEYRIFKNQDLLNIIKVYEAFLFGNIFG
jgi:hypothetical protein